MVICRKTGMLGTVEQTELMGANLWRRVTWEDSTAGESSWYGPRDLFLVPTEDSLRFGTFGPPSNEPSAYLMSTLGMTEFGEKAPLVSYAYSVKSPDREDRPFFWHVDYGSWGLYLGGNDLGVIYCRALGAKPAENQKEGVFCCPIESPKAESCRAIGRAALDRYLAFLFLHRESDAWSHGEAFGLWLGRTMGRAEMREHAAEVAERCSGGDADLSQRDLIAAKIRALEVWQ